MLPLNLDQLSATTIVQKGRKGDLTNNDGVMSAGTLNTQMSVEGEEKITSNASCQGRKMRARKNHFKNSIAINKFRSITTK